MLSTDIGQLDGKSWERICQSTLKVKFGSIGYIEVPASPGDYGIDGIITSNGDVYQCYCPEQDYPFKELYENQRDKITQDISKLKLYEKEIATLLNGTIIKRWIFLTPKVLSKQLINHCNTKANELKNLNLSFIDKNIQVQTQDYEYLKPELTIVLQGLNHKIDVKAELKNQDELVNNYKSNETSLIDRAFTKHTQRFKIANPENAKTINKFVYNTVEYYLKGEEIIRKWETSFEEQYQAFKRVKNTFEAEVEDLCINPTDNNNKRYIDIRDALRERLKLEFSDSLSTNMIDELTHHVVADWILRCPLSF